MFIYLYPKIKCSNILQGIADLFIIDPDGYVIRKWQSKELNNGVLSGKFELPEYPKVGFWRVRVEAQGQRNEKAIKVSCSN